MDEKTNDKEEPNLSVLGDVAHPFDQTNGIVEGLEGDSDGFAEENASDETENPGDEPGIAVPPIPLR